MGNSSTKSQGVNRDRPKKNVHWKSAEPPSVPGKPIQIPIFDSSRAVLSIKWEKPSRDGGSPVMGYLLEQRRVGSPIWMKASATLLQYPEVTLTGVDPAWRYQFRVFAQNVVGISESSPVSDVMSAIIQRNGASAPQFLNDLQNAIVLENDQCEFHISVIGTPSPQINWFKDGFEIFSSRRTKIICEPGSSTLIFHQVALTDEGEIKCTATNRFGHVVTRFFLQVEASPKIRLPRQYEDGLLVEAGEVMKLKVGIAGRPVPAITWSHNGNIIRNGGRFEIITNDKNSFLKIMKVTRADRGEYNVRAINKLGEFNAYVLLTVTAKPGPPTNVRITMALGKSVTLSWNSPEDDGGCKIGNYIVEYFRIGWDVWLKASSTRQLSTTLNDLIEGSEYKFRVKAESPYGLSEPSEESRILFIPDHKRGIVTPTTERSTRTTMTPTLTPKLLRKETVQADKEPVNEFEIPYVPRAAEFVSQVYNKTSNVSNTNEVTANSTSKNLEMFRESSLDEKKLHSTEAEMTIRPESASNQNFNYTAIDSMGKTQSEVRVTKNSNLIQSQESQDIEIRSSNEFMLVLHDDGKQPNEEENHFDLDLQEAISAPPLSLSTPDLHDMSIQSAFQPLRRSASSSELLYEKAMQRFYQAVELDEAETASKRGASVEPKSSYQHMDYTRIHDTELIETKSNENTLTQKLMDNTIDSNQKERDTAVNLQLKSKNNDDTKEDYDRDLRKEVIESQLKYSSGSHESQRREFCEDDYTESTASTGSVSTTTSISMDSVEQFMKSVRSASTSTTNTRQQPSNDELETYHPRMEARALSPYRTPEWGQATINLNKPAPLPDPDYVPKPILKRPEKIERVEKKNGTRTGKVGKSDPEKIVTNEERSRSLPSTPKPEKEKRSFLQLFGKKITPGPVNDTMAKKASDEMAKSTQNAAETDDKENVHLTSQSSIDENKVVIDHYSDLVKELGGKTHPRIPLYMNRDAMHEADIQAEMEERMLAEKRERDQYSAERSQLGSPVMQHMDPEEVLELAKKMSHYTDADNDETPAEPQQKEFVEISVQQTKSISYAVRQIKQPDNISNNESTYQVNAKSFTGSTKSADDSSDTANAIDTNEITTRVRSSRSRQSSQNRRSQSKSPVSAERKTSLTSTVLKVTRVEIPIQNESIDIDLPNSPSPSPEPEPDLEPRCKTPEQIETEAMTNIRSTFNFTTDLVLLLLACWLYLFRDARLSIPVLILIVYRRVQKSIETKLQKWTKRKRQ